MKNQGKHRGIQGVVSFGFALIALMHVTFAFGSDCQVCEDAGDGNVLCVPWVSDSQMPGRPATDLASNDKAHKSYNEARHFSHGGDYLDSNETDSMLQIYFSAMENVEKSIKNRVFQEPIDTGKLGIEQWLQQTLNQLHTARNQHAESRHLWEGLGWAYKELYEHTGKEEYLVKAADAFLKAEDLGLKYQGAIVGSCHYFQTVSKILAELHDTSRLDAYFEKMLGAFPDNGQIPLYYALALSKLGDGRADTFFQKAISLRQPGVFTSVTGYAEYLLDQSDNKKALQVLERQLTPEDESFYPHFLKGVALERLGRFEEAKEEYKAYLGFTGPDYDKKTYNGPFMPPARFMIPGSKLQTDIPFRPESSLSGMGIMVMRPTPSCSDTDWACKARYYMVWTINGEAEGATAPLA